MRGGERRLWSWGTAVVRQLGQEEEEEALAVRHLWGNLGILLQGRNAALLASFLLPVIVVGGRLARRCVTLWCGEKED